MQTLCGAHVGWLATYTAKYRGKKIVYESLVLPGATIYSVTYARLASRPESPLARAALNTLCPFSVDNPSTE